MAVSVIDDAAIRRTMPLDVFQVDPVADLALGSILASQVDAGPLLPLRAGGASAAEGLPLGKRSLPFGRHSTKPGARESW